MSNECWSVDSTLTAHCKNHLYMGALRRNKSSNSLSFRCLQFILNLPGKHYSPPNKTDKHQKKLKDNEKEI